LLGRQLVSSSRATDLVAALRAAGMADVPDRFSIASVHQEISHEVLGEIDEFIRLFDRVTRREAWRAEAMAAGPAIVRSARPETCFFSAWDFHLPPARPGEWQLVEFNDNGSGFLCAALLNHHHYELSGLKLRRPLEAPPSPSSFTERLIGMVRTEAEAFFGSTTWGRVLILDDADSMKRGRFRDELGLLCQLCRAAGWDAGLATPGDVKWDGAQLLHDGRAVSFVVNRSTDFFWEGEEFCALRAAYAERTVYVAPNPFTYATRSDKRLLEWLSNPARDADLGIRPDEREALSAHVPETHVLREDNLNELAVSHEDWFFKPSQGFASRGLLPGTEVGRRRLRRLLEKGLSYVAQRRAPKLRLETDQGVSLWTDLRVWAYRGERFLLSGRASRAPDRLDLAPPGGWLPTYAQLP